MPYVGELFELHREGQPRVRRGDEMPNVAEVDGRESVWRVVAVLKYVDEGCAGQRCSVCVHVDALEA